MSSDSTAEPEEREQPESYWLGQDLDWNAVLRDVTLYTELPFWLMVPNCSIRVEVQGHEFEVDISDCSFEVYADLVRDSRASCIYIGSNPDNLEPDIKKFIEEEEVPITVRKCKTVLRIHSACNTDVLDAEEEESRRSNAAHWYLRAFCEAHLPIVNKLLQHYRLATYDYMPYEVGPWDVPVWFVEKGTGSVRIVLLDYAKWDFRPLLRHSGENVETYNLISPEELQVAMSTQPSAGEFELLDATNLLQRSDYSGAVRRVATAIEALVSSLLRVELVNHYGEERAGRIYNDLKHNTFKQMQRYLTLSGRDMPEYYSTELTAIRNLRHDIVHHGYRVSFVERGLAQRSVDIGRWLYNWLEQRPERVEVREKRIALRSLGRYFSLFNAEITDACVIVHKPDHMEDEQEQASTTEEQ